MATINYTHDDDIEEELKTQIIEICTASVHKPGKYIIHIMMIVRL